MQPRDASTVILARPAADGGYEVLLTRRPDTMRFMGGMYVFPGGALDDEDCGPEIESLSSLSATEARDRIGEDIAPERALGLFCCAARELFEEVGILLARDVSGADVDPMLVHAHATRHEGDDALTFARFLRAASLVLATDRLVWHGRLVTPEISPIRFDARFFVAACPAGQTLVLEQGEVPEAVWVSPRDAIRAAGDGTMAIPIPTMAIMQGLSEVPALDALLRGARVNREILIAPLSPLVSYVLAPNPGPMTGPGTNTYVVGDGSTVIIDPAVPDAIYIEQLLRHAASRGRPELVLLTHMHPDHTGGASVVASQLGIPVAAWRGVEDGIVSRRLDDGDVVEVGGATLRALYTPGHASHHLCYLLEQEGSLFAGDVVAGLGTVVIAPPDGNMRHYFDTLRRLQDAGVGRIYPGHGPAVEDGQAKLAEYVAHRLDRERQVLEALEAGAADTSGMVKRIYVEVPESLHPMAELSVLAHLEMLESDGRVRREGTAWALVG